MPVCIFAITHMQKRIVEQLDNLAVAFAAASLWFLFALKDFSSAVRDAHETPPGVVQYIFFGIVCLSLLLIFVAGVVMLVLGLTRVRRAPNNPFKRER